MKRAYRVLLVVALGSGCYSQSVAGVGSGPGSSDEDAGSTGSGGADGGTAAADDGGGPVLPALDAGPIVCYSESVNPAASIDDLQNAFITGDNGNWLMTSLEVLKRRQDGGHFLLDAMKTDSQLPGFVDSSSFPGLMQALMTMCHEETHGYDYGNANAMRFSYYMNPGLSVTPEQLQFFPRSEIAPMITDDSTKSYDDTYLTGTQGTYDFVALNDELNAYTNGLACIASVGDKVTGGISARDGAVAHLYYLELYLRKARVDHAALYASMKASVDWQKFVRFAWARVHFWVRVSMPYPLLGIGDAAIWAHVNDPANLAEIQLFTGSDPAVIACTP